MENVLGRVLEAFQARMNALLGSALCKGFAENPALALQMAAEPAAVHAGKPVAFFVGKATDTSDSFVKAIVQSGFGSGDSATETIVLQQFAQVFLHACWHCCVSASVALITWHSITNAGSASTLVAKIIARPFTTIS